MSLILDALNRAERERRNADNRVPDLQTIHVPAAEPAQQKSRNNVWIILLPVVLVIIIAAVWFWPKKAEVLPVAAPVVVLQETAKAEQAVVPEIVNREAATPVVPEAAPQTPATIVEPQPQPQPQPQPHSAATTESAAPVEFTETESAAETTVDELAALYATADESESTPAPAEPQSLYEPEPEPIPAPVVAAQETLPPVSTSLPPAMPVQEEIRNYESLRNLPDIGDLPWSLRQEIPSINYARHNFEDGQANVLINGRAWQTGAVIAPDLKLEEIYTDGVIMSFRQVRFKLRALNSWINM